MTGTAKHTRTVVKERELAHPPDKVWRALTEKHLIEDWLMHNDFRPTVGHSFELEAEWGNVTCEVLAVEPHKTLAYTWQAHGLESVVTWTLSKSETGTRLRMEQTGFGTEQEQAYRGATSGWNRFLDRLETVVAELN